MLKNYLVVSLRNLWRYPSYSLISILGLATGMASCLTILFHVRSELSYDRFHERPEEIYRVQMRYEVQGNPGVYPIVGYVWADYMTEELPQVKAAMRLYKPQESTVVYEAKRFDAQAVYYADSNYTDVFALENLAGDPMAALAQPNSILLSESAARRYFGFDDPLGRTLRLNGAVELEVKGVVSAYPVASHFHFDGLISMGTLKQVEGPEDPLFHEPQFISFYTYIRTGEPEVVAGGLRKYCDTHLSERTREFMKEPYLMPLTDIHLHANSKWELGENSNAFFVNILRVTGIFILLFAGINHTNLATALASNRGKEVGMRKVVGARRRDLVLQFLGESVLVSFLALPLGLVMAGLIRVVMERLAGIDVHLGFQADPFTFLLLLGTLLFSGLLAGLYPAFFLSRFRPVQVLSGRFRMGIKGGGLRRLLVGIQLSLSTALIIGTAILLKQLNFIRTMDMGFGKDWRIVIPLPKDGGEQSRIAVAKRLKETIVQNPGVISASAATSAPGGFRLVTWVRVSGQPEETVHQPFAISVDFEYAEVMGLQILEGRNFNERYGTDSTTAVLVNEALLRTLNIPGTPLGREMIFMRNGHFAGDAPGDRVRIIGVFRDMHFEPLYQEIHPMILRVRPEEWNYLMVRLRPENWTSTLEQTEEFWKEALPGEPFQYSFLEDDLAKIYRKEDQLGLLITFFTMVGILIAGLGLFGLSAFGAQQRRKEVSIRKVFGAGIFQVTALLAKESLFLVLLVFPFAALLAWWATRFWLQTFAYRTAPGIGLYLAAMLLSAVISLVAVGYHTYRAATENPVDSLHRD